MLERDKERIADAFDRVSRSPLGAAALAGTSFPIDRDAVAASLGMEAVIENSIDAVSDRDAQIESISCCAIVMMHLSRLAEELVMWSSSEWSFVRIGDDFTTGSSIMPQKKNPDMAELIRGKTGRVYGALVALLTTMKGLPLAYNRDMQEDKEPLFDALDTAASCLNIMAKMMATVEFNAKRFEADLESDEYLATEIADYLARKNMPFREAYGIAGAIVAECEHKGIRLSKLPLADYAKHSKLFQRDIYNCLNARASLRSKKSSGSTSPREVEKSLRGWRRKIS
jgi:argininosuccinate lyase